MTRDWLHLWWYNNIRRHYRHWIFRWRWFDAWVAEGKDPAMFYLTKPGRISMDDLRWARQRAKELNLL